MAYPQLSNLKRLRGELTLERLSGDLDISVSQLSRYETGERDPKLADLRKLAAYLKTTVADLIGEAASAAPAVSPRNWKDDDTIQVEVRLLRGLICEALGDAGIRANEAQAYADGVLGLLREHEGANVVVRLGARPIAAAVPAHEADHP